MVDKKSEEKEAVEESNAPHAAPEDSEPKTLAAEQVSKDAPRMPISVDVGDDDDETWTNQPAGQAAAEKEAPMDDLEEEDEEEEEAPPVTRKVIQTGRDVVTEELPARAARAKDRLRPHLTGALVIELSNSGEKFLFDWRSDEPKVSPVSGDITLASPENTSPSAVDCIISVTEQNLMSIRSGDLNPQVAMLADKIKVKGKMSPAVYLFNLVAPRMRPQ
jgi:hypothetical protein